jgi:cytochrome c oxidase cbb3-type subunit 3
MMSFDKTLAKREIEAVVDFVRQEFMIESRENTRYHTAENGWPEHEKKYRAAYPFALGQLSIDVPWDQLSDEQQIGKRVFLSSCVSCHDRGYAPNESALWELRPLSFPRNGYSHVDHDTDTISGASPYDIHEVAPNLSTLSAEERTGEQIFQRNCAFCHGADGTGRNWIGSFLDAHPRDLTGARVASLSDEQLVSAISNGIVGTTMPAWKSVLTEQQISAVVAYVRRAFVANGSASLR